MIAGPFSSRGGRSYFPETRWRMGSSRQSNPLLILFWFLQHGAAILRVWPWSAMGVCLSTVEVIHLMVWIPVSAVGILGWTWPKFFRTCSDTPGWLSVSAFPIKYGCSWGCGTYWRRSLLSHSLELFFCMILLSFSPAFSCSGVSLLRPECPGPGFSGMEATYFLQVERDQWNWLQGFV